MDITQTVLRLKLTAIQAYDLYIYVAHLNCYKHYLFLFYKVEGVYVFTWWSCFLTLPVSRDLSSLPQQSPWAKKWTNRVYCLATPLTDIFWVLGANWARTGDDPQNWETKKKFTRAPHKDTALNNMRSYAEFMTESPFNWSPLSEKNPKYFW